MFYRFGCKNLVKSQSPRPKQFLVLAESQPMPSSPRGRSRKMSTTAPAVVAQLVETMRALAGPHPGFRPVHAKGIVCSGTFRSSAQARSVSRALHLQGQTVQTVIRFSNSSGNPEVHDGVANA